MENWWLIRILYREMYRKIMRHRPVHMAWPGGLSQSRQMSELLYIPDKDGRIHSLPYGSCDLSLNGHCDRFTGELLYRLACCKKGGFIHLAGENFLFAEFSMRDRTQPVVFYLTKVHWSNKIKEVQKRKGELWWKSGSFHQSARLLHTVLSSFFQILWRILAMDGFEGFHFHQLRHTYTSNPLLANGAAPKECAGTVRALRHGCFAMPPLS